jgi:hypothetical protein
MVKVDRRAIAGLGVLIAISQVGSLVAAVIVKNHPMTASFLTTRPATLLLALRYATNDASILAAAALRFLVGTAVGFVLGRRSVNAKPTAQPPADRLAVGLILAAPGPAAGGLAGWRNISQRLFATALLTGSGLRLALAYELVRRGTFNSNGAIRVLEIIQWISIAIVVVQVARSIQGAMKRRSNDESDKSTAPIP